MYRLLYVLFVILLSCQYQDKFPAALPKSYGKPYELLIVMDSISWNNHLGDTVKKYLTADFLVLPQSEPVFDLRYKSKENLYKENYKHRNILFIAALDQKNKTALYINKIVAKKKMKKNSGLYYFSVKDMWAKPQIITYLYATTNDELLKGLATTIKQLIPHFKDFEDIVFQKILYSSKENLKIKTLLKTKYNIFLHIPATFKPAIIDSNFIWLRKKVRDASLNIIIYITPFNKHNPFSDEIFIQRKNNFGKYVTGEIEGSYMVTDTIIPVLHKEIFINELYSIESRGLWRLKNDFMGGPFINYTIYDKEFDRILTLEGFVYAPGKKKRNKIRELEITLTSLNFIPKN